MSIYPDKKHGELTGWYRVEVQKNSQRLRGRFRDLKEAQEAERHFTARLASGEVPEATRRFQAEASRPQTVREAVKRAQSRLWRGQRSEATAIVRLERAAAVIGLDRHLDSITTEDVDDLIEALAREGRADATINRYLSSLRTFLVWCAEPGRAYRTKPLPSFAWRDEDEGRIRWLTESEERKLLKLLPAAIGDVVRVAIVTGMRRGELLSLEPDQVERGWVRLWRTKTNTPRSIPINEATYARLARLTGKHPHNVATMPTANEVRYQWAKARTAMGLDDDPHFVFHALRHTCATRLVQANVNLRIVQRYMGHKRIETTIRYAHVHDEMLTDALDKLDNLQIGDSRASVAHLEVNQRGNCQASPTRGNKAETVPHPGQLTGHPANDVSAILQ